MTSPADFVVATCNAKKELGPTAAKAVVRQAAANADVIFWQEIETAAHKAAIVGLAEFHTYWPGGSANAVPISFRKTRFRLVSKSKTRLHFGRRGNTPARWSVTVSLEDFVSRKTTAFQGCHLVQQAFTSRPKNLPLWKKGARIVTARAKRAVRTRGAVVGGGDMNRNRWAPAGTKAVWTSHGTYGNAHYDTLFYAGSVRLIDGPERIPTVSDHDILLATFRRTA